MTLNGSGKSMMIDWKEKEFIECLIPVSIERMRQIQTNSYIRVGKYPVVDQGKDLIAGWTNEESALIKEALPLIIFGDHTRVFKYVDFLFALGADGTKLIKPKQDEFSTRFFYYYLLTLNIPGRGYNRHYKLLKEQRIRYPSLTEQQKIAAVLFKIQQAIKIQESIIEKMRELKKSTMHHVFTQGLRGEKLKETEIGLMPESWDPIKIGDCCDIRSSTVSFNELNQGRSDDNDVLCYAIKVSDMNLPGNEKYIFAANIETELSSKLVSEKAIPANSVIFPKRGAAIATNKKRLTTLWSLLDPNLIAIIPRARITSEFLYYWFLTFDLASIQDLGPTPQLNKKDVEPISIPCPSDSEQFEISNIFRSIDQKIDLHTAKKSAMQNLFKTMLNKLMTGDIRVKDLDIDVSEVSA